MNLDEAQLRSGSIVYSGRDDVVFRLELPGGKTQTAHLLNEAPPDLGARDPVGISARTWLRGISDNIIPGLSAQSDSPTPRSHSLGLWVERWSTGLRVSWDVNAPEIRRAESARLVIVAAGSEGVVNLSRAQLRSGSIAYSGRDDVVFRLELPGGETEDARL